MTYRGPTRHRHLHRGHFAFMRAVVQGLPSEGVWDRYLSIEGQRSDERVVRSTIRWIREEFAAAAGRESRFGTARLLRMEVERLVDAAPSLPSLAQFAEEAGLEDASEREQIEAFQARYGAATGRLRGKGRLLRRQLDALRWLEDLVARRPAAGDEIAAWLRPELASALQDSGILTIAQLAERVQGVGRGWANGVRGIGTLKAARIVEWLRTHSDSIGIELGRHVGRPRRKVPGSELAQLVAPATDVRPLEKFVVPAELDGSRGVFRQPRTHCLLDADNDLQAIHAWLRSKRPASALQRAVGAVGAAHGQGQGAETPTPEDPLAASLSHTQRSYRKEAERFLLWAILQRRKPLSSMTAEDCIAYRDFLGDPQPRSRWCGPRARERWSPLWRPFEGPLSPQAQRLALTILKSLYAYLVDQNYLMGNPWSAVAKPRALRPGLDAGRSLTQAQWALVRSQARAEAGEGRGSIAARRLLLTLELLYATGLRASELLAVRLGDLERVELLDGPGEEVVSGWLLRVTGKGEKPREVPVPDPVIAAIDEYLVLRGTDGGVRDDQRRNEPLLAAVPGGRSEGSMASPRDPAAISSGTLYRQLKELFARCSLQLRRQGDAAGARKLEAASTHWMRHTHVSHALAAGVPIEIAQQNAGHASLSTTSIYVTTEKAARLRAMQHLWGAQDEREAASLPGDPTLTLRVQVQPSIQTSTS